MLAISLSLLVIGVLVAIAGPRGFVLGLGGALMATLCAIGKGFKVMSDIFGFFDLLELIFNILSLFG